MTIHPKYGICLDAGSGIGPRRPAQGFSAHADIIVPRAQDVVPENYHVAPLEDMSCFHDKQFDYVRCYHAIEHCQDPERACSELIRVGKKGVISFPPAQAEMCYGRKEHNWYVFVDRHRLVFVPKFHESLGIPRRVAGGALNVDFPWQGSFDFVILKPQTLRLRPVAEKEVSHAGLAVAAV